MSVKHPADHPQIFIDGAGKRLVVHEYGEECEISCCIHNPSDHPLKDAPLVWRQAWTMYDMKPSHMERICEHGVGHPDPDQDTYLRSIGLTELADQLVVHGCDGCCQGPRA